MSEQSGSDPVYCRKCGESIPASVVICPVCGSRQKALDPDVEQITKGNNPYIALGISLIIPGVGQFYNREWKKGALVFASAMLLHLFVFPFGLLIQGIGAYDAYVVSKERRATIAEIEQ